jgi:hypothetical protein
VMHFLCRSVTSFGQTVLTQEAVSVHAVVSYIPPCLGSVESLSEVSHKIRKPCR